MLFAFEFWSKGNVPKHNRQFYMSYTYVTGPEKIHLFIIIILLWCISPFL